MESDWHEVRDFIGMPPESTAIKMMEDIGNIA